MDRYIKKVNDWWQGEYIPYDDDATGFVIRVGGYHDKPRLRLALEACGKFYLAHWKWIITTGIAVAFGIAAL